MKKRIEEDGVVYTIDATSGNCIDIDVKPGVEEVSFNIYRLVTRASINDIFIYSKKTSRLKSRECAG